VNGWTLKMTQTYHSLARIELSEIGNFVQFMLEGNILKSATSKGNVDPFELNFSSYKGSKSTSTCAIMRLETDKCVVFVIKDEFKIRFYRATTPQLIGCLGRNNREGTVTKYTI
jgi:hypothetical protein